MSTPPSEPLAPVATFPPTVDPPTSFLPALKLPPSLALSPRRNPDTASSSNAQYSVQADEDRGQLRNQLKDRVHVVNKPNDFWGPILSTGSVSDAIVADLRVLIQEDIDQLCKLAKGKNPLEDDMYGPLTRIFEAITSGDHGEANKIRFWKDHHTKYPGVDPDVLISGLEAQGELPAGTSLDAESVNSRGSYKRRKIAYEATTYTPSADSSEDNIKGDPRFEDGDYKRKLPLKVGTTQRVVDTRKPDWILLDADSAGIMPYNPLWRQIAVIFELKATRSLAPTKVQPESGLVAQCADYARLHLALRPFQRFSIHFSLCGNLFNAWLIDRTGVIISDTVDIGTDKGISIFIRALVQVTNNLSMHDLGMDPTVTVDAGHMGDSTMPRFTVRMPSGNLYATKGLPIWQSSSLFGRGTVVWKVEEESVSIQDELKEPRHASIQGASATDQAYKRDLILKSAYRHPERIAESNFYAAINHANHPGVAAFLEGGDVVHNGEKITTAAHRHGLTPSTEDSVAHRLVLKSKGRRLSEYNTLLELLEAVIASVKGHETLFKYGIIHRDISIGNVFISDDPDMTPGFLGDLDMAKVYDANKLATLIGIDAAQKMIKDTSQGSVTGTAQFMALSLLKENAIVHENKKLEGRRRRNPTVTTYTRLPRWTQSTTENSVPIPSSTSRPKSVDDHHSVKLATEDDGSQGTTVDLSTVPRSEINWELAARNDLESFIWVMFYAFCVHEMNSRSPTKGIDGRTWYCRNTFIPLFGGVSFQKTFQSHLFASEAMMDESSHELEIWKLDRIQELRYWDILADLMTCAKRGTLDHLTFQAILEHYIKEEKQHMGTRDDAEP